MPTIARDGVKLAYEMRGSGTPTLLFVHGWTCDRSFFEPQMQHFTRGNRVVTVDLRGHGESDKPEGDYPIATFADDLAHIIGTLRLGEVVAVGHSMGGLTVLQLAVSHPARVAGIVMLDPAPLAFPPELRAVAEELIATLEAGRHDAQRRFIEQQMFLKKSTPALVRRVCEVMCGTPAHVAVSAMKGMLAFDGVAAAAQCKVPALHIAAAQPFNPPPLMAERLPGVVTGMTVGAGHFNQLEAADQVNGMIEGFLRHHL